MRKRRCSPWNGHKHRKESWFRRVFNYWGYYCFLCNKEFEFGEEITFEHLIPKSKGGLDRIENVVFAHAKCNHDRRNNSFIKFVNKLEKH